MTLADGIIAYFTNTEGLADGWDKLAPKYYSFHLDDGFKNTQLVLAAADGGVIVNLVTKSSSYSVYVLDNSSPEQVRTQLDAFVRDYHTATAVHHRKLSDPTPPGEKVESNVKRPSELSPLTQLGPGDAGLSKPVFEDEFDLTSRVGGGNGNIAIGKRDLDPLGIGSGVPAPGAPSAPGAPGPGAGISLPSQGGMHPTPWGARRDPPGPNFGNLP